MTLPSNLSSATPSADLPLEKTLPSLTLRPATAADLDLLVAMRRACGWGDLEVPDRLAAAAAGTEVTYVFELKGEPAGMGSIVFEKDKEGITSREEGRMMISRLFLYPEHHGKAYGNQMMSLLEGLCFDKFAARAITLSVMAFEPFTARTADEAEGPSRNKQWYQRLGYVEFKDPAPLYVYPPDLTLVACFLEKKARA